jgi:hypothetical protein
MHENGKSIADDVFVVANSIGRFAGSAVFMLVILGFRFAPPQALCPHPLRGLKTEVRVERGIYLIRGHKVMIDADLAELYEVPTKRFNQQVRRNLKRFPEDFMFQLTKDEGESLRSQFAISNTSQGSLRSQFATSKTRRGGRRYLPYAFTEQGVAMLPNSPRSGRRHKAWGEAQRNPRNLRGEYPKPAERLTVDRQE